MEGYGLEKVHEANLKVLDEVDRICRKYRIRYMLDAGTLVGAVRHKGFIPWDDDVDIIFTRSQYEAFLKVATRELPETMELMDYRKFHGGRGFYDFTPRILYLPSKKHEDGAEMEFYDGKLNHLWVDLFVLDELPEGNGGSSLGACPSHGDIRLGYGAPLPPGSVSSWKEGTAGDRPSVRGRETDPDEMALFVAAQACPAV